MTVTSVGVEDVEVGVDEVEVGVDKVVFVSVLEVSVVDELED